MLKIQYQAKFKKDYKKSMPIYNFHEKPPEHKPGGLNF